MPDYDEYIDAISESSDPAEMAAYAIFADIKGRRGVGNEMENIDDDILLNMIEGWVSIIRNGPA